MVKKAQSSTEFLATYGWALLIMFIILAMLIGSGVFNPTRYANEECTFQPNLPCSQYYLTPSGKGASLSFNITNTMGFPIAIMGYASEVDKYLTNCLDAACHEPVYLNQGDSYLVVIDPINLPYAYNEADFAKIKTTLQFKNCKGKTPNDCFLSTDPTYFTAGRINLFPRGKIEAGGASDTICTDGQERCLFPGANGDYEVCSNGVWGSPSSCSSGEVCVQNGDYKLCQSTGTSSCVSGESKCIGNVQVPCMEPDWGSPDINGQPCSDAMGGPICEDYTDSGLRKTRCIPATIETCPIIPPLTAPAAVGTEICDATIPNAYIECKSGGEWYGVPCPNPTDACDQTTSTSVNCLVTCDPPPGSLTRANVDDQYCHERITNAFYTCGSDGLWLGTSCPSQTDVCSPNSLDPNKITCEPPLLGSCTNPTGSLGDLICRTPLDYFTQDRCVQLGQTFSWKSELCPTDQKCLNGACKSDLATPNCQPGSLACGTGINKDKVEHCTLDSQAGEFGYQYDPAPIDCTMQGAMCDRGACTNLLQSPECDSSEVFCSQTREQIGLAVWECRGGTLVQTEYCEGDTYCKNGQCRPR